MFECAEVQFPPKEQPLISVIIPVYNAERYLHRCVDSVRNQTYQNLEIILVDDGSPDRCGEICDEYAAADNRIKVIHQKNGGPSSARNAGLSVLRGDYVAFVDSDDYILPDMYSQMYAALKNDEADICVCQWQYEMADGKHVVSSGKISSTLFGTMDFSHFVHFLYKGSYENGVVVSLWNKLYPSDMFSDVVMSGYYAEDDSIANCIFSRKGKVCVLPQQFYVYTQNFESLTNDIFNQRKLHFLDVLEERCRLFASDNYIVMETRRLYCNMYIEYYFKAKELNISMPSTKSFDHMVYLLWKKRSARFRFFIRMILFRLFPSLYEKLLIR